jgi:hypothetical protein
MKFDKSILTDEVLKRYIAELERRNLKYNFPNTTGFESAFLPLGWGGLIQGASFTIYLLYQSQ